MLLAYIKHNDNKVITIIMTFIMNNWPFSSLRRLKTWLRRTMSQKRLTHLPLLHCHRVRVENINIQCAKTSHWRQTSAVVHLV